MASEPRDLYGAFKGSRERLCWAQSRVEHVHHRIMLQHAIDAIDRLGVFYAPDRWSKFDEPKMPGEA